MMIANPTIPATTPSQVDWSRRELTTTLATKPVTTTMIIQKMILKPFMINIIHSLSSPHRTQLTATTQYVISLSYDRARGIQKNLQLSGGLQPMGRDVSIENTSY